MTTPTAGQRIYYTGDIANPSGWFVVAPVSTPTIGTLFLVEDGGDRSFTVAPCQIGELYQGHCNPRFVTETAYTTYRAGASEAIQTAAARRAQDFRRSA